MLTLRRLAISAAVATACASATPAVASDFDDVAYLIVGGAGTLGVLAILTVLWLRKSAGRYGAKADVVAALAIAAILAPAMVRENEYGVHLTLLPHWLALLGGGWSAYLPWPFLSFVGSTVLIYLLFAGLRRKAVGDRSETAG